MAKLNKNKKLKQRNINKMSENYYGSRLDNSLEAQLGRAWRDRKDRKEWLKSLPPNERRAYRIEKAKDSALNTLGFIALFAALDGAAYGAEKAFHLKPPVDYEQKSPTHINQPGIGTLHTKDGSFSVSQPKEFGLNTAVQAHNVGDRIVESQVK